MNLYHIQLTKIICVAIAEESYLAAVATATAKEETFDGAWKAAMEAWPEAAEIIASAAEVDVGNTMTRPLEALLSRYIPMLAAPNTQGA